MFRTIFTSAAGFLLASRDKKVTHVTQRFFWRRREDTPVVYIRNNTRVLPSYYDTQKGRLAYHRHLSPYRFSATPVALNEPFWEIDLFCTKTQSLTPRPVYRWKAETVSFLQI